MSLVERYYDVKEVEGRNGVKSKVSELNTTRVVVHGAIAFVSLITLMMVWPFCSVPTGSRGVVTQFGAIERIQNEGLAILPPWQKLFLFSIRTEAADIKDAPGSTRDLQQVDTSLTVRYSIKPDQVSMVFEKYSHDGDLSSYVQTATMEVFKAVTARYEATELISKRPQVSSDINEALQVKLDKYGAQVINIDMKNFTFNPIYMAAVNEKVTQEQKKLAAENMVKTVNAEQQAKVVTAEAEANAIKARADGDKYATIAEAQGAAERTKLNAEAQANAIKVQQAALAAGTNVLELRRIEVELTKAQKWNGALPVNVYAGAPIPFLNAPVGK